jgi:1-acyl-sn-glycerol-3-phosphate acyltransferase
MAERTARLDGSPVFWVFLKHVALGPGLRLMFRPKVRGLENIPKEGGAIIAANHVSFLDPLLVPLVVPRRRVMFLTKTKYIDKPGLHQFLSGAGVIPVASDAPGAAGGAVPAGVRAVQEGRLVGIFPEGTRSKDGLLHRGKTGVARIAIQAGVPVIPVGVVGTDRAFPRGAKLPRPRTAYITFGKPIVFDLPPDSAKDPAVSRSATDRVMAAIQELSGQQRGADVTPAV